MKRRSPRWTKPLSPKLSLSRCFPAMLASLFLLLAGCATTAKTPTDSSPIAATGSPAEQLSRKVNQWHDSALAGMSTPFIFDEEKVHDFARIFIARACPDEAGSAQAAVSAKCNRRFGAAVAEVLHERYFAADTDAVQAHCRAEPLTCEDARTFEVLFRQEHNAGIERSRADKLEKITEWKDGRITAQALEQALHFSFELSNGELTTPVPGPARNPAGG